MSTLSERLSEAMAEAGVTAADLARATGTKAPSVHKWVHGQTKNIRGANLVAAAQLLNVNEAWLADGHGPKTRNSKPDLWPFPTISASEFAQLSQADKDDIVALIETKISRLRKNASPRSA